ncbi:MAG: phosphotransferase [Alphaproteobacteria bacterium]|nr:phosphotransferase [Alphaproteobacteria bacterium]
MTTQDALQSGLGRYLSEKWRTPVAIEAMARIPGGASRQTWKVTARRGDAREGLIIRLDPASSLIDTDRRTEYRAIEAAFKSGLPVPEPLVLEEDLSWLGQSFSLTREVPGCDASADKFPDAHRAAIGRRKWQILGEIARLDPIALDLTSTMPATTRETCAMEQLDYWAGVIEADEIHPNPVAHATIRWLRRNAPPPAQKLSLVHGDFRSGNFLFTQEGAIKAILDWEMAHIGDPLEDLAWSLDPLWSWANPALAGMLLPHDEAIRCWEDASGLRVDPQAFRWWQIFASLKGIAIWISSSEDFHAGAAKEPILAVAGWLMTDRQQQILIDRLAPHLHTRFPEARS